MLFQRNLHSKKICENKYPLLQSKSPIVSSDIVCIEKDKSVNRVKINLARLKLRRRLLLRLFCLLSFTLLTLNLWYQPRPPSFPSTHLEDEYHDSAYHINTDSLESITSTQQERKNQQQNIFLQNPTNHACRRYRGIYHIEKGDIGGAAGTIFFQFVIGQIIWAEKYNFKPWVYLNNVSHIVYDPVVHGNNNTGVNFTMQKGMEISLIRRPMGHRRDAYPGKPIDSPNNLRSFHYNFDGNGVWDNYFEPISDFIPGDKSCQNKPLVTMNLYQVTPGVHGFSDVPKCWRYDYLPDYITKPHIPLNDWLAPQRRSAHDVLKRYIRFKPHIKVKAENVNPNCSIETNNSCIGIHIRHSDKAAGRRILDTDEFLPYVEAFLNAGGKWVYLATDSEKVIAHIKTRWPDNVLKVIRSMGDDVIRSNGVQAVFDLGSHHRTNTEILVEILALSYCQFMIHGLSAVTESSIWINIDLHHTSVNLEDQDHSDEKEFGDLVGKVLAGGNASHILEKRNSINNIDNNWWMPKAHEVQSPTILQQPNVKGCDDSTNGILHISHVVANAGPGTALFTSVLNQLMYAERNNLTPFIHLSNESKLIYDDEIHGEATGEEPVFEAIHDTLMFTMSRNENNASFTYPGPVVVEDSGQNLQSRKKEILLRGNGIWASYFHSVSDFIPSKSCSDKPILCMDEHMVSALNSLSPWSIKAWQYDDIPNELWNPKGLTLKSWLEPMRIKANDLVKRYYKFQPFIANRAQQVNPFNSTSSPCLAVHLLNTDKEGIHREKFPPNKFREYLNAFARAGGKHIYIASDSRRPLEYISEHFPSSIQRMIRTQGPYVVRSSWKWPTHMLENRHRTNAEVLVDILAMSKCQFLLHGNSAISEAAIYLNLNLHNNSVNMEDPDRFNVGQFEVLVRRVVVIAMSGDEATTTTNVRDLPEQRPILESSNANVMIDIESGDYSPPTENNNVKIIQGNLNRECKRNAIVYLAQKKHSSYERDSYQSLLKSLDLMNSNYLSINKHQNNTDIIIFHTGDFNQDDMEIMENKFGSTFRSALYFINLYNTSYWQRPSWHHNDNPSTDWYAYPLFSEGYRQMMHWYAIDIWRFFTDYGNNKKEGKDNEKTATYVRANNNSDGFGNCSYEYIMRFDEDSYLRSQLSYDVFDYMKNNDYNYGFRLCSYEMQVTQRIWKIWRKTSKGSPQPIRDIDSNMCGIYNNFFVARVSFFLDNGVQKFLKLVDRQGMIYRRRLGDLMIHSMVVYAFSPAERIHRFLDFTYEHSTVNTTTGCVVWGGIQAGYNDPNSNITLTNYYREKVVSAGNNNINCTAVSINASYYLVQDDLSVMYQHHLPLKYLNTSEKLKLKTIMAGKVEYPGQGLLSG